MDFAGHTLDGKYQIESELGRGGMGKVYLATHLGTERPVAVKIIAPQYMRRPEFVERFRREARAAGRLRHPNVVDVTDFGFADTDQGRVAYLVMEYLDGCTLGEILEEEKNLPVGWTLDILDQICSAVHEAHQQGIIHRDLKPDNIWLEPNQRGGYTVKVLDFGIAKLETQSLVSDLRASEAEGEAVPRPTIAESLAGSTMNDGVSPTLHANASTHAASAMAPDGFFERETMIEHAETAAEAASGKSATEREQADTRLISSSDDVLPANRSLFDSDDSAAALTKVGSVLGTPLYMSPEQCRSKKLDARSDVYSLGVIAYQMLSGSTPFTGEFTDVMRSHRELPPPPLRSKKARKKLKRVIISALSKNPDERPQSAEAFANGLRSRSEGIFGLLRRAGMIYTEHMPKFLMLSAFFHLPMILLTGVLMTLNLLKAFGVINATAANVSSVISGLALSIVAAFSNYLITGTITWIVVQSLAVPLRPIRLRASLQEARRKWKTFAGAGILTTIFAIVFGGLVFSVGFLVLFLIGWLFLSAGFSALVSFAAAGVLGSVGFIAASVLLMLAASVVMMEKTTVLQSMKRSGNLVRRSPLTALAALLIMFTLPAAGAGLISLFVNSTATAIESKVGTIDEQGNATQKSGEPPIADEQKQEGGIRFTYPNRRVRIGDNGHPGDNPIREALLESLLQIILLPLQIIVTSFTAIIVALLYLKTRQAGGETLRDLLSKFEETDAPRKKWQERMRGRLLQSGRISNDTDNAC